MTVYGSTVTWDSVGADFTNDTAPYVSKTDNGLYLVRFTIGGDAKVIAVRNPIEIPIEIMKIITGEVATTEAALLKEQVQGFIARAAVSIPMENTIGA